ncbi:MAG: hypothetical protein WA715_06345 [Candidatus Acidiferrum sp.]
MPAVSTRVKSRTATVPMCEELKALKYEAAHVLRSLRRIRRSRDISFLEDAELARLKHTSVNAVVKHLLVGHQGQPCPAGERPIVKAKAAASGR